MKNQALLSLASILAAASAHTIFVQLESAGTTYPISYGIRDPTYDGPITDVTTNDLACNGGPNPTTASPYIINVNAGSTVQATWRHTLTSTAANDAVYVIDPSHLGPVMAYMKKVSNATSDVGYGSGWFKISEAGLNVATQDWATTDLIANAGVQNIQIPSCIEDGQYLLRAELIALHAASSYPGAQLYMECAQINVSGGTGSVTPSTVSLPGAYSGTDPGILINIYQTLTTYTIPGPTPLVCGAGSSPASSSISSKATSSSVKATSTPTTLATSTKVSTTAVVSPTGATAPLYGQCGGSGWTGATVCASGTCTASSTYYSQCLP